MPRYLMFRIDIYRISFIQWEKLDAQVPFLATLEKFFEEQW